MRLTHLPAAQPARTARAPPPMPNSWRPTQQRSRHQRVYLRCAQCGADLEAYTGSTDSSLMGHIGSTSTEASQPLILPKSVAVRSKEGQKKPQCAQCGKRHHGQRRTRSYTSTHRESLTGGWKGGRIGDGKGTQKGGNPRKGETQGKGKVKGKKGQRLNELREPPEEQWASGSWEQWSEQSWPTEAGSVSWREKQMYGLEARESCAPSMHQESQLSWKVQKSTVDDC